MTENQNDIQKLVEEHDDFISEVLKHSDDPYARGCALVLLKHGKTESELDAVIQELKKCRQ